MVKYMTQELFNMMAITTIKISVSNKQTIEEVAKSLTEKYMEFDEPALSQEIVIAAHSVNDFLIKTFTSETLIGNLTQMQYCIKSYQLNGKKKKHKLFAGTFFNNEKKKQEEKHRVCLANIATYHNLVLKGAIPLAPSGWSI